MSLKRPKRQCRKSGCTTLVDVSVSTYCEKHNVNKNERFEQINERKTDEQKAFYGSFKWRETSRVHREIEPLCRRCKSQGLVTTAELVHHSPDLQTLLTNGFNPFDHRFLESLCHNHHQQELRAKR